VAVAGSLAYVTDWDSGLQIIDVSNPTNPVRRGGYDTPGWANGVAVAGSLAYVADFYGGLMILQTRSLTDAWRAEFWNNETLTGTPVLVRTDAAINFDWTGGSPAAGVNADHFSARWTRQVNFSAAGAYQFRILRDDGARLWIDGVLVFNAWRDGREEHTFTYTLTSGNHDLRFEMYEIDGWSRAGLSWTRLTEGMLPDSELSVPTAPPTPSAAPSATPALSPTPSATPTETPTLTATATYTPTATITPTEIPTLTVTATFTPTATVTASPTLTPTATVTPTDSPTPTDTPTPTLTVTPTPTNAPPLPTPTPSETPTPTVTPTEAHLPAPTLTVESEQRGGHSLDVIGWGRPLQFLSLAVSWLASRRVGRS
ncbi:MAG: PA14 domain-containing protein, partial [Anaerolineae bacterium]